MPRQREKSGVTKPKYPKCDATFSRTYARKMHLARGNCKRRGSIIRSRACEECRRRKIKCSSDNLCSTCVKYKRQCIRVETSISSTPRPPSKSVSRYDSPDSAPTLREWTFCSILFDMPSRSDGRELGYEIVHVNAYVTKIDTRVHFKLTEETIVELLRVHLIHFSWCEAYNGKLQELEVLNTWFELALGESVYITDYETLASLKDGDDVSVDISSHMKESILDMFYSP